MEVLVALLLILGGYAAVLGTLAWLASRARRRGAGSGGSGTGSVLGPFEEIWHPAAYRARFEQHAQHERPAPPPGDGST